MSNCSQLVVHFLYSSANKQLLVLFVHIMHRAFNIEAVPNHKSGNSAAIFILTLVIVSGVTIYKWPRPTVCLITHTLFIQCAGRHMIYLRLSWPRFNTFSSH